MPSHPLKWRVVKGLLRTVNPSRLRQTAGRIAARQGLLWCLSTECWVQREFFYHGEWDANETREVLKHLPESAIFLDVGSYFGYYALMVARYGPGQPRVYAFEPVPSNLDRLRRNIELNRLSGVTALAVAASDREGEADLVLPPKTNLGSGHLSSSPATATDGRATHRVRMMTLDAFVRAYNLPTVSFIKLDVEGVELAVLHGAVETLRRFQPGVLLELNPSALRETGTDPRDILNFLEKLGYGFQEPIKGGLRAFTAGDLERHPRLLAGGYVNLLCLPKASSS